MLSLLCDFVVNHNGGASPTLPLDPRPENAKPDTEHQVGPDLAMPAAAPASKSPDVGGHDASRQIEAMIGVRGFEGGARAEPVADAPNEPNVRRLLAGKRKAIWPNEPNLRRSVWVRRALDEGMSGITRGIGR